jgi:hypothetical protein
MTDGHPIRRRQTPKLDLYKLLHMHLQTVMFGHLLLDLGTSKAHYLGRDVIAAFSAPDVSWIAWKVDG